MVYNITLDKNILLAQSRYSFVALNQNIYFSTQLFNGRLFRDNKVNCNLRLLFLN